ncbi:uncharacterized protein BP5553_07965 [Venustampulla echinocandica]|uniref:Telomere replication protein EST3 n=1 Tax=Venustampulla echinocandica TaxID=2656787 RepID=A0A370TFC4_9HELO|nr:uncharacterized protein BP5553_07965 [Venustampulla echinocandica]RDL33597.1 hypothetical protein BP5553_07965 [Venustampulla echinocandica]
MSDLMRNWILPLIKDELTLVVENFPLSSTRDREGHMGSCRYHGCGFTVHLGAGKPVQVIDLHGNHAFNVTVSDGMTSIQAKIHDRNLTDIALGSVIAVNRYNLPITIWNQSTIGSLVGKLSDLFDGGETQPSFRSDSASPLQLQELCGSVEIMPLAMASTSQIPFATQMQNQTKRKRDMDNEARASNKEQLLGVLMKKWKQKPAVWQDESTTNGVAQGALEALGPKADKPAVLSQVSADKLLRISSGIDANANVRQSQVSLSSQSSFSSSNPKALSLTADSPYQIALPAVASYDSEKENSLESLKPATVSVRVSKSNSPSPALDGEPNEAPMQVVGPFFGDPFAGMRRVPRRYVQLSKAQKELLARQDSWFKPGMDSRASYAITPAQVQEDLITFITRVSGQGSVRQSQDIDTGSGESETSHECDNEVHEENSEDYHSSMNNENFGISDSHRSNENVSHSLDSPLNLESTSPGNSPALPSSGLERSYATPAKAGTDNRSPTEHKSSGRGCSPWSSSPEMHLTHTLAGLDRRLFPLLDDTEQCNDPEGHTNVGMSPGMASIPRLARSSGGVSLENSRPCQSKRVPVVFSSSPAAEEELELDVLHAIGEAPEYNEEDTVHITEMPENPPSTALQIPMLVQVEQTPAIKTYNDNHDPSCSGSAARVLKQRKRHPQLSSDPIIPATCDDSSSIQPEVLSSEHTNAVRESIATVQQLGREPRDTFSKRSDETTDDVGGTYEDCPTKQIPARLECSPIQDGTTRTAQTMTAFCLGKDVKPGGFSTHSSKDSLPPHDLACESNSPQAITTLPGLISASKERAVRQNSPSPVHPLKRGTETLDRDPQLAGIKRRRRMQAVSAIVLEEPAELDTKAMARASRHMFNNQLVAIEPLRSLNRRRPDSEPDSEKAPHELRPATPSTRNSSAKQVSGVLSCSGTLQSTKSKAQTVSETLIEVPQPASIAERTVGERTPSAPIEGTESVDPLTLTESGLNSLTDADIYTRFKASYPDFAGSRRAFTWALVYVEWLRKAKQLLHRSLCDDFIRVISSDYVEYVSNIRSTGGEAMTGWSFYDETVVQQKYSRGIISPSNLQDALATLEQEEVQRIRRQFNQPRVTDPTQSREKEVSTSPHPKQQQVTVVRGSTSKSTRRRLPWSNTTPLSTSNEDLRGPKGRSATSTPSPLLRHKFSELSQKSKSFVVHRGANRPRSPVPGNGSEPPSTKPSKTRRVESRTSPSPDPTQFRTRSQSASNDASSRKGGQGHTIDGITKVKGWLNARVEAETEPPSFMTFIKRRKSSGGFLSNKSTPSSTPEKRFCTKAKQPIAELKEPETQAWEVLM